MKSKFKKKKIKVYLPRSLKIASFFAALLVLFFGLIEASLSTLSPSLPAQGRPPQLYATQCGDDLCLNIKQALKKAKESILIEIYSLTDKQIAQILREKADEGVKVTVLYDKSASPNLKTTLGKKIKTISRKNISGLMHRKIIVIDQSQVWLGSANLTYASLRMHDNLILGLHAPAVAELLTEKSSRFLLVKPSSKRSRQNFMISGQQIRFWFLPEDHDSLESLLGLIRGAEKTIKIAMYTWTHPQIAEEVVKAFHKGVDVQIALDRQMSHGANSKIVEILKKNQIPLGFNKGDQLLHHKFAYIDGSKLAMGSANWTRAAFSKNDDIFFILEPLSDEQIKVMETLWNAIIKECEIPSANSLLLQQACCQ